MLTCKGDGRQHGKHQMQDFNTKDINPVLDKIGKLASLFLFSLLIAVTNTLILEVRAAEPKLNLLLFPRKTTYLPQIRNIFQIRILWRGNWNENRLSSYLVRWHKEEKKKKNHSFAGINIFSQSKIA